MNKTMIPQIQLNDGKTIPQFGLGVYQVAAEQTQALVEAAIGLGYRHIDTASLYGNEKEVGLAVNASAVSRSELFVTTKLWNNDQPNPRDAFNRSLERLGLDYVDLYLIHWPCPAAGLYLKAWEALLEIQQSGLSRSVGVSNFMPEHLQAIVKAGLPMPAVNQIELHPWLQQRDAVAASAEADVKIEAWSPLGRGSRDLDTIEPLTAAARKYGKSAAQVVLRWHIQKDNIVFPKTANPQRLQENLQIFDFALTAEEVAAIDSLNTDVRTGPDPREFIAGLEQLL